LGLEVAQSYPEAKPHKEAEDVVLIPPIPEGNISGANHNFVKTRANHGKNIV